jgi:medium-chain acyl-[acyl-carrier-protein] hydrolase
MNLSSWVMRQAGGAKRFRLYCFCYAGGSAAVYLPWQALVDPSVEICAIQLPGRGVRLMEEPCRDLPLLVETLAQVMDAQHDLPFAFFGHSMGGLIAFELARYCERNARPVPQRLFVSGCNAPQFRNSPRALHKLPDDELIEALRDYNGTPRELLEHREFMAMVLPSIRADFELVECYGYRPQAPLNIPLTALAGKFDDHGSTEQVEGWGTETAAAFKVKWFEGDHFFINTEQREVLDFLNAELAKMGIGRWSEAA